MSIQTWEYDLGTFCHREYYHGSGKIRQYLATQGAAGWELVSVLTFPATEPRRPAGLVYYWKRPAQE
jgi:hypothetical protein